MAIPICAVADIGTHWMDLAQYLIATPIRAVIADLATFHPRRYKPSDPSDTFSGSNKSGGPRSVRDVEITSDDHAAVLLRFDGACGVHSTSRKSPPAARTA